MYKDSNFRLSEIQMLLNVDTRRSRGQLQAVLGEFIIKFDTIVLVPSIRILQDPFRIHQDPSGPFPDTSALVGIVKPLKHVNLKVNIWSTPVSNIYLKLELCKLNKNNYYYIGWIYKDKITKLMICISSLFDKQIWKISENV